MATDWQVMENEYVTTDISLQGLADKYGAALRTVKRRSKTGDWTKKRTEYGTNVALKCHQICEDHDIAAILSQRSEIMKAYKNSIRALHRVVKQMEDGEIVAPKDVTEVAKAITMYMDNDERLFGAKEDTRAQYTFSVTEGEMTVDEALG